MAWFGLSPNQLKLCSASMAKSDNNRTLVCGAEMLRQGRLGTGVPRVDACVCMFSRLFLLVVLFICWKAGDKEKQRERKGLR